MPYNRIKFMNTYIDNVSKEEAITHIERCIIDKKISHVITPNVDQIVRIEKDKYFSEICNNAELLLVDGTPLMWIAKAYKTPFKEKICGSHLMPELCKIASEKGYKVFILGAAPGVADMAAHNLKVEYPTLNIVGTYSPPLGFEKDINEIEKINILLLSSGADMLFVGMGVPKQDIFIYENMNKYKIPVSFSIGGTIDFIAGTQKKAPKWVNKIGLEWFYRFLCNPKRLFKRYFIDDVKIIGLFFKYKNQGERNEDIIN